MAKAPTPRRGEIWLVDFDPAAGAEIQRVRPALVVSMDSIGRLPLRIVVPMTDWKPQYGNYPWIVELPASAADTFQTKSVALSRFVRLPGQVAHDQLDDVGSAIAMCVGAP